MSALLSIANVSKRFRGLVAVDRVPTQPRGQPQLVGRGQVLDEVFDRILEDVGDGEAAQLAPLASACGGHRTTGDLQ